MTKDELIDKYRYWVLEHIDWYESTYEYFKDDMTAIGINVEQPYFSGFYSQGDGACFEGSVEDWDLFLRSLGYTDKVLIQHAMDHCYFKVEHSGRYYHEECTIFSTELCTAPSPSCGTDDSTKLEEVFKEAFKSHMRQLYINLKKEHDYLISDEGVWDSLVANEMTDELDEV